MSTAKERKNAERNSPEAKFSRALTYILRHKAVKFKMTVDDEGYVPVSELQKHQSLRDFKPITIEKLQKVVQDCKKQRFSLKQDGNEWFMRANQGHSGEVAECLDDEKMLVPVLSSKDHPICVHGTDMKSWALIEKSGGLSKMNRKHIHMSTQHKGSDKMISGMRPSSKVMIYIDLDKAIANGIKFFISKNEVILTEGNDQGMIPKDFFKEVKFLD